MKVPELTDGVGCESDAVAATSELNNLLQIIAGTTDLLEDIWHGAEGSERYLAMLRFSVERAARVTAQLVEQAGGARMQILSPAGRADLLPPALPLPAGIKPRLLLVDDEPLTLELFRKLLEEEGCLITTAESGFEALDLLSRRGAEFDLVLLDYTMPFMNGEETFRRIRILTPTTPVVLATGFIRQEVLDGLLAAGLAGFIRKPLPPRELLAHVAEVLARAHPAGKGSPAHGIAAAN